MALRMKVKLTGDKRFRRAVGKLKLPDAEPIYRRALDDSAELVLEKTRHNLSGAVLPVRTGRLRGSIEVDRSGLPKSITIGSGLVYAAPLHFGWRAHGIEPHPFLERALDRSVPRFPQIWIDAMGREVRSVR